MNIESKRYDAPKEKVGVQVIGLGPAGAGVAVASDHLNKFDQLHGDHTFQGGSRGVAYIDANSLDNTGRLGYKIDSNSPGGDFLEVIHPDGKFQKVLLSQVGQFLKEHETEEIPLVQANEFHKQIVHTLDNILRGYSQSNIYPQTLIDQIIIEELKNGGFVVRSFVEGEEFVQSDNLVLATGAQGEIIKELQRYAEKTHLADDVLYDDVLIDDIRNKANQGNQQVDIIGGSHSLGSLLWKLIKSQYNQKNGTALHDTKITAHYMSDFKFFYNSEKEAQEDGFNYDKDEDVCHETGRVFRFGGVRGPYKKLLHDILKQLEETGEYKDAYGNEVVLHKYDGDIDGLHQTLENSDAIIQAIGLKSKEIPVYYQSSDGGQKECIEFEKDQQGNFFVDKNGKMYAKSENGKVIIPRLYGSGFGKVPKTSSGVGEPSFKYGPEGVNIYQGAHGKNLVKDLLRVTRNTRKLVREVQNVHSLKA